MKKISFAVCLVLFGSFLATPLTIFAQDSDREFYLRPSFWRPYDKRGINVFETPKTPDSIPYEGVRFRIGAGFTQQFQNLHHENPTAIAQGGTTVGTAGPNRLYPVQPGFMTAQANLFTDIQLADGIRLNLTTYLSSRHHNETWVKGGYIQFDRLPFRGQFWNDLMRNITIKMGHMEINYGDQHFRRSDGGHTLQNPFMDNYIMDAFTTEIGGEVYFQKNGFLAMVGLTNGMIRGNIDSAQATVQDDDTRINPSLLAKLGFDRTVGSNMRFRLTGSFYHNSSAPTAGLTLYSGDRTGSNYQNIMERWLSGSAVTASTAMYTSGRLNPGFSKKMNAFMINGFFKLSGFEFFGTYENATGRTRTETAERDASQYAVEGLYRFGRNEDVYAGVRYNSVDAQLAGIANEVNVNRLAVAAGWFITRNILLKAEYVRQQYKDFPTTDFRSGGKFDGYVIEAAVGF